jgi:predicted transcriptional regulator
MTDLTGQHSRGDHALSEEIDASSEHSHIVAAVQQGLAEADAGLLLTDEQLGRELDQEFGPLKR